jgi:hypothetical protein
MNDHRDTPYARRSDAAQGADDPAAAPAGVPRADTPEDHAPGRGRSAVGKRSDPDYEQVSAYIRRTTYRDVTIALLRAEDGRDFSDLVETLLAHWLAAQC